MFIIFFVEFWDIYDENKKLTGRTMKRDDWTMKEGDYHLTALGFIMRPDGRVLITRRNADKSWAPLWWEIPGGGVRAGETSEAAVRREVKEEVGVDVSLAPCELIFSYRSNNPPDYGDHYFVDVYRFDVDVTEADVRIQESELCEFKFASAEEIAAIGEAGVFLHYNSIKEVFALITTSR